MRTRSQSRNNSSQQEASPAIVEPLLIELSFQEDQFQEDPPEVPMADNRTMVELLQAPTEGYEDVIVILEIAANNFELKHGLINLVQNKQFFGHDKEDPNAHIYYFNKITSTMRVPNVPSSACPHHGFSELHKLDTFDNALNVNDQDSLNSAAGGNFLDKMPRECLKIIESKSKVRQSRAKAVVAKVSMSSSTPAISSDVAELKDMVRALLLDKKNQSSAPSVTPATVKAVESNCVTCGGAHSYQNCPATSRNVYRDNIQEYVSQAAAANYNQGNTSFRPQMVANQIRPPGFPPVQTHQNNQNNFNRGNNFNQSNFNQGGNINQGQLHQPQVNQFVYTQIDIPNFINQSNEPLVIRNVVRRSTPDGHHIVSFDYSNLKLSFSHGNEWEHVALQSPIGEILRKTDKPISFTTGDESDEEYAYQLAAGDRHLLHIENGYDDELQMDDMDNDYESHKVNPDGQPADAKSVDSALTGAQALEEKEDVNDVSDESEVEASSSSSIYATTHNKKMFLSLWILRTTGVFQIETDIFKL
nr:1-phosphatidylinositol-3-phosphate 5-kinase FAB1B-like [Tanacetum cinerariifolium]